VAVQGVGALGSRQADQPQPIASVAKVMTAFIVLHDHPLGPRANGPEIQVTPEDVYTYMVDRESGQSTAAVVDGEQLSERQALEGLLLPSANNLATLLARWDAGGEEAFVNKMNAEARGLGMAHTHYADASGFSADTVSTANDQLRLAVRALRIPALAQIVALKQARLPLDGILRNRDVLLGSDGVVGVKTGNTLAAGACFVFAVRFEEGERTVTLIGAVLGQPSTLAHPLDAAFAATTELLASARRQLVRLDSVVSGRAFGELRSAWGRRVRVGLQRVPDLIGWQGLPLRIQVSRVGRVRAPVSPGQVVAAAIIRAGDQRVRVPLVARRALPEPSVGWRLTHP
jgi:D-alanyl-D-alanine carboxypeptidase (penicillin-binding protein 5/6)